MKEFDIRPDALFENYLRLAESDAKKYFSDAPRNQIKCPACRSDGNSIFNKAGFTYQECPECRTLFVSPRPSADAFNRYYIESDSSKFWATKFYKETAAARREKIWKPKAKMIRSIMDRKNLLDANLVDIGGGYGLFAEEMSLLTGKDVTVIEPAPHLAEACREKGLPVIECFLEEIETSALPETPRFYVSFELFEHLHDPGLFLKQLRRVMAKDDVFVFTTLSGVGADIRALWQDSKSVVPPHHLNFFNPFSIKILLENNGFTTLETTTPGRLDIDILCNNRKHIKDRFWQIFVEQANLDQKESMQSLLASTGFSSHMMVVSCIH